jgi:hypothetical protein
MQLVMINVSIDLSVTHQLATVTIGDGKRSVIRFPGPNPSPELWLHSPHIDYLSDRKPFAYVSLDLQ